MHVCYLQFLGGKNTSAAISVRYSAISLACYNLLQMATDVVVVSHICANELEGSAWCVLE